MQRGAPRTFDWSTEAEIAAAARAVAAIEPGATDEPVQDARRLIWSSRRF